MRLYPSFVRLAVFALLVVAALPVAGWKWTGITHR
jgi:hypothetical protein